MIYPNIIQCLYESPAKWVLLFLHWVMFSLPIIITLMTNDLSVLIMINMLSVKFVYVKSFLYLSSVTVTNDGDRVDSNTSQLL